MIYMLIMATLIDPSEFMPLFAAGTMIICISIVAHGISAAPASRALVRYLAKRPAKD